VEKYLEFGGKKVTMPTKPKEESTPPKDIEKPKFPNPEAKPKETDPPKKEPAKSDKDTVRNALFPQFHAVELTVTPYTSFTDGALGRNALIAAG
jgi:hypothetical protein